MLEVIENTERFARPFIQKAEPLSAGAQRPAQVWPMALGAVVVEELVALLGLGLLEPTSRSLRRVDEEISAKVIDFLDRNDPKKTGKPLQPVPLKKPDA